MEREFPCARPVFHEGECQTRPLGMTKEGPVYLPFAHPHPEWSGLHPKTKRCEKPVTITWKSNE